jgi:hypothetical protein
MSLETPPRKQPERTGRHFCSHCLKEISSDEYFRGDFYCQECAENDQAFPLATTPDAKSDEKQ